MDIFKFKKGAYNLKCLRCGYCCIQLTVIIVNDPDLGIIDENLIAIGTNGPERCPHLIGDGPGKYECAIHEYEFYKDTPCYRHKQIEHSDSDCRMGKYILSQRGMNGSNK